MKSIWNSGGVTKYPALTEDLTKEVIVVGGGIAGYLAAFKLAEGGQDVALLEARELFSGTTHKTTAHIDALQSLIYGDLVKSSVKKAKLYFESQVDAINEYENLIDKYNIQCEFKRHDSYIVADNYDRDIAKEADALQKIGADISLEIDSNRFNNSEADISYNADNAQPFTPMFDGAKTTIKVPLMAAFNPILFLRGLPVNFDIYENTRVTSVDFSKKRLAANGCKVSANKIVFATNFPIVNFPGWYFVRMYRSTSYAIAADNAPPLDAVYQSVSESGMTFRSYKNWVIVGGLDHRTGRLDDVEKHQKLYIKAKETIPCDKMSHHWSANDCITFDNIPFVGYYSRKSKDIFVITGFNKYGMANAMTASSLISGYINGFAANDMTKDTNTVESDKSHCTCIAAAKYKKIFSPQRYTSLFAFTKNFLSVVKNLIIMPLSLPFRSWKNIKRGEGAIAMYKGKKRAVYIDDEGKPHLCGPLCAHLKCQLKFNPIEKTWDCPCHGSRFDVDGKILIGPAVKNLKTYK